MLDFSVTFGFTLLNIFILFIILRVILFKPVTRFMEKRAASIAADIERAESGKAQAQNLLRDYEARLRNAETEAGEIIRAAREEARKQAEKIAADAKAEAQAVLAAARAQAETEHRAALSSFRAEAAGLVVTAAGRLLMRDMTTEDSMRHAELLLREAGEN